MSYTTPPTFVAGDVLAAADLNILGDDIVYEKAITDGLAASAVQVSRTATTSVPDSTSTTITFSAELFDIGSWWASGTDIIVPAGAIPSGMTNILVHVEAELRWFSNSTGARAITVYVNGSPVLPGRRVAAVNGDSTDTGVSRYISVAAADVITIHIYQNSGGSLNFSSCYVSVVRVAPIS